MFRPPGIIRGGPTTAAKPARIVARRKKSLAFLALDEVWAIEAANRLTFVHTQFGRFELDLSLDSIEATSSISLTRVHRNWLVNLTHVREIERTGGATVLAVCWAGRWRIGSRHPRTCGPRTCAAKT
jgi:DNA-binding LytR/AlgR family response regulator